MIQPSSSLSPTGCRLVSIDGPPLPLRAVRLTVDAANGLARIVLRQTFANPHPDPLEVHYQLPLPADSAVVDFAFVVGGSRIQGRVARRDEARAAFEDAVLEGRTASLLEQERSSLFTQRLGNVPPHSVVEVHLEIEQPLGWEDGQWTWRFPTVVAPRYLGTDTTDPERVHLDVAQTDPAIPCEVRVRIGDTLTAEATTPTHTLRQEDGAHVLMGTLDRDVVVRWPVAQPRAQVALETTTVDGEAYGLVTVVPAASPAVAPVPRDLTLLLDTSGSMNGRPLAQLQRFCEALIQGLGPSDRLEMSSFANQVTTWRTAPVSMDAHARASALQWVAELKACGGTRMHDGITHAMRSLRPDAVRQVVLVTDGLIGFEERVVGQVLRQLPDGCRLHTVGIGSAVNRSLTGPAARAGAGHESVVGIDEPVEPVVARLLAHTERPAVVDLRVTGSAVLDRAPHRVPDLLAGAPARISVRLNPEGGTLRVEGRTSAGPFLEETQVWAPEAGRRVVATRYARERVEDLELRVAAGDPEEAVREEIELLGLTHRIATRYTSWVATSEQPTVDADAPTRHAVVPQAQPHGMNVLSGSLRSAMPQKSRAPARRRLAVAEDSMAPPFEASESMVPRGPRPPAPVRAKKMRRRIPTPPAAAPGRAPIELVARVRRQQDGVVVLEVTLTEALRWTRPQQVQVTDASGTAHTVTVAAGTRDGTLEAQQVLRLAIQWPGPHAPVTVAVNPSLTLRIQ